MSFTSDLQDSRHRETPLLITIDQEGGQLHAFSAPATLWPGTMAVGAADDADLTRRVDAVAVAEAITGRSPIA